MNKKLETKIGKLTFRTPVFCSSGCFGFGYEAAKFTDISKIGAISYKTLTLEARDGNPPSRVHEVASAVITSIGLQNPGFDVFINQIFDKSKMLISPDQRFLSMAGKTPEEYIKLAKKIADHIKPDEIAALEINACCPNVTAGGGSLSKDPKALNMLLKQIIDIVPFPVIPKIALDCDYYRDTAKAVEDAGAIALYFSPTPLGMAINIETATPFLGNLKGGVSGPAVRPFGISYTWELSKVVNIPIIASGGVVTWQDAAEYLMAGATAVAIGAGNFANPNAAVEVAEGLGYFLDRKGYESVSDIVGLAIKKWENKN